MCIIFITLQTFSVIKVNEVVNVRADQLLRVKLCRTRLWNPIGYSSWWINLVVVENLSPLCFTSNFHRWVLCRRKNLGTRVLGDTNVELTRLLLSRLQRSHGGSGEKVTHFLAGVYGISPWQSARRPSYSIYTGCKYVRVPVCVFETMWKYFAFCNVSCCCLTCSARWAVMTS